MQRLHCPRSRGLFRRASSGSLLALAIFGALILLTPSAFGSPAEVLDPAPATGTPDGTQPGPDWIHLGTPAVLSTATFRWVYGTPTGDGCSYGGSAVISAGGPTTLIGIWANPATCTMEIAAGQPTSAFQAELMAARSHLGYQLRGSPNQRRALAGSRVSPAAAGPKRSVKLQADHYHEWWFGTYSDSAGFMYGVDDQLNWNGVWSYPPDCWALDTWRMGSVGAPYTSTLSNPPNGCYVGLYQGNHWDLTEAAASWNVEDTWRPPGCPGGGATGRWWTLVHGRDSNSPWADWSFTYGGPCGAYQYPLVWYVQAY